MADFDTWLRAEGHSRNPGTTADLMTACLFVLLREDTIPLPSQIPWTLEPAVSLAGEGWIKDDGVKHA